VEYINANRIRHLLVQEMEKLMSEVDVYVAPSFGGDNLLLTNLTGHPCVVLPNGFDEKGSPVSITFVAGSSTRVAARRRQGVPGRDGVPSRTSAALSLAIAGS